MANSKKVEAFAEGLTKEESMLVTLRDELYGGSWDRMSRDLEDRLKGKPYIFKLVNRIEEDLERIRKMKSFEEENKVNLKDIIEERRVGCEKK